METRLTNWGKSMYGGYYATVIVTADGKDKVLGLHANSYGDMKRQLEGYELKANRNKRIDH